MLCNVNHYVIQTLNSVPSYAVSVQTEHCNAYTKNPPAQVCVKFLILCLVNNVDHPMTGQNKRWEVHQLEEGSEGVSDQLGGWKI